MASAHIWDSCDIGGDRLVPLRRGERNVDKFGLGFDFLVTGDVHPIMQLLFGANTFVHTDTRSPCQVDQHSHTTTECTAPHGLAKTPGGNCLFPLFLRLYYL